MIPNKYILILTSASQEQLRNTRVKLKLGNVLCRWLTENGQFSKVLFCLGSLCSHEEKVENWSDLFRLCPTINLHKLFCLHAGFLRELHLNSRANMNRALHLMMSNQVYNIADYFV